MATPASCDTWLVVSGGVDCRRRRWNVYDKKPQRYAKDNRTVHLTARNDKSVAYVTNNERLYSTFCTVEANYWQTRSIARPVCDTRATCIWTTSVYQQFLWQWKTKLGASKGLQESQRLLHWEFLLSFLMPNKGSQGSQCTLKDN